jgi:hypothetical protein
VLLEVEGALGVYAGNEDVVGVPAVPPDVELLEAAPEDDVSAIDARYNDECGPAPEPLEAKKEKVVEAPVLPDVEDEASAVDARYSDEYGPEPKCVGGWTEGALGSLT